jgi:hypothetical protein
MRLTFIIFFKYHSFLPTVVYLYVPIFLKVLLSSELSYIPSMICLDIERRMVGRGFKSFGFN